MKHLHIYIFAFCFLPFSVILASHNRAGEITYRCLGDNKYEITVTTYTRTTSFSADRCTIEIDYHDGSPKDTVYRINGTPCTMSEPPCNKCGDIIPANTDIKINVYRTVHIFPGPGDYTISVDDPNRNADVENIPSSDQVSFYIESELKINPFLKCNSSPVLDFPPIDEACAGKLYEHNPGAHDPDGDILKYFIAPSRGSNGTLIQDYAFPNETCPGGGSLSIDENTGTLTWNTPKCCFSNIHSEFNIAIRIEEYRRKVDGTLVKIGSVLRDMQIDVSCSCNNDPPKIIAPLQMCVYAGDTINTVIAANDPNTGDSITMTATGEPFELINSPAAFLQPVTGQDSVSSVFNWKTNCSHVRSNVYDVIFRAEDNYKYVPLVDYHTLGIKITAPRVENPLATAVGNDIKLDWDASKCTTSGYKIYRRVDSAGFSVDSCQPGLPSGTGYAEIANCSTVTGTSYTDNNNSAGLGHGVKYCYVIIACLTNGSENMVSEEFCAELKFDVPVITNVSVFETDPTNGKDSVMWAMPKELDTSQYLPPYQYKVYRLSGNNFTPIGTTAESDTLAFTDTAFVNNVLHDTKNSSNTYKVELWSDSNLVGSTQSASSVFLQAAPTDNALQLNWQENVPWLNSKYFIYKKQTSGLFDFLDSSLTKSYKDTGLVNGEEYCYYVQSYGGYASPGIAFPLLNNSQVLCAKPYDNVPPCPPGALKIQPDCENFESLLKWNNPNNDCADDVVGYKIYYTPTFEGNFSFIQSNNSSGDTSYANHNLNTIAGCYAVSALDTNKNESALSDTVCFDNCPRYELPNVFTPGTDGKNDLMRPFPYRYVSAINMQIFNRWGDVVFETANPDIMWDGKHQKSKKMCTAGVYYYLCRVHVIRLAGEETFLLKGYVHVLPEGAGAALPSN